MARIWHRDDYPSPMREILTTERLLLRPLEPDDLDTLIEVLGDPVAMRYYPAPFDRDRVAAWIEGARRSYRDNGFGPWAVIRRSDGRFLGDCGPMLQTVEDHVIPEVGYHIVPAEQGRGYATEAAGACVAWVLREHELRHRLLPCDPGERAVARGRREDPRLDAGVHVGQARQDDVPLLDRAPSLIGVTARALSELPETT